MRILFAGTPEIAVPSLNALLAMPPPVTVVGVLTNPDAPAGRGRELTAPPVKKAAMAAGVPVLQPDRLDAATRTAVAGFHPDLLVCVAYGRFFGPRFLALFAYGGVNVHPSLLPRHRGPTPIQGAILAGDAETGVTVQTLAATMDAGAVLAQRRIALEGRETSPQLHLQLGRLGASALVETVRALQIGNAVAVAQDDSLATYTRLLRREDGHLSWKEPARQIDRMVRAYEPWPGVSARWRGVTLRLITAEVAAEAQSAAEGAVPGTVVAVDSARGILVQTTDGVLAIQRLQLQSRSAMDWKPFINGNPELLHSVLEQA